MSRTITNLVFNWHQSTNDDGACADCEEYAVGKPKYWNTPYFKASENAPLVTSIEIDSKDEGYSGPDTYLVHFSDGKMERIYNPNQVFYSAPQGGK